MNARTFQKIEESGTNIHVFYNKQTNEIITGIVDDYQNGTLILLDLDKTELKKYKSTGNFYLPLNRTYTTIERKTHRIKGSHLEHLGELL